MRYSSKILSVTNLLLLLVPVHIPVLVVHVPVLVRSKDVYAQQPRRYRKNHFGRFFLHFVSVTTVLTL